MHLAVLGREAHEAAVYGHRSRPLGRSGGGRHAGTITGDAAPRSARRDVPVQPRVPVPRGGPRAAATPPRADAGVELDGDDASRCATTRRPSAWRSPARRPTCGRRRRPLRPTTARRTPSSFDACRAYHRPGGRIGPLPDHDDLAAALRAAAKERRMSTRDRRPRARTSGCPPPTAARSSLDELGRRAGRGRRLLVQPLPLRAGVGGALQRHRARVRRPRRRRRWRSAPTTPSATPATRSRTWSCAPPRRGYAFAYAHDDSQEVAARLRRRAHAGRVRARRRGAGHVPRRDRRLDRARGAVDRALAARRARRRARRARPGRGRDRRPWAAPSSGVALSRP